MFDLYFNDKFFVGSFDNIFCVSGCGHVETTDHLLLSCTSFAPLWEQVRRWIGFVGADSNNISDHLTQFTFMTCVGKVKSSFLQLIWLLCTWVLWNECNNRLFNNVVTDVPRLLDKIKLLSLMWLKAKKAIFVFGTHGWWSSHLKAIFVFGTHGWWSSHLVCLSIG